MTSPIITKRAEDPSDVCAICQDGFNGEKGLTHFRGEQHLFHPRCFLTWMDR